MLILNYTTVYVVFKKLLNTETFNEFLTQMYVYRAALYKNFILIKMMLRIQLRHAFASQYDTIYRAKKHRGRKVYTENCMRGVKNT